MNRLLKVRETWLALAILALLVAVTFRAPGFANPDNLVSIFNDTSILLILALFGATAEQAADKRIEKRTVRAAGQEG